MGEPFLGEIRIFSFSFLPKGWAGCYGQLLPIAQNQALYSLLQTTFGGDGLTTFALPNLQSRTAAGAGGSAGPIGSAGGGSGASANYLAVNYAIAIQGLYPGP